MIWKAILWGNAIGWALSSVGWFVIYSKTGFLPYLMTSISMTLASLFFILLISYTDDEEK